MQFAKGITSGYIPFGGIGVSDTIKEAIDTTPPDKRWMHAYTYSAHPTCCAVALANIDILSNEGLVQHATDCMKACIPLMTRPTLGTCEGLA